MSAVAVGLAACVAHAQQPPIEFKGIAMGAPASVVTETFRGIECSPTGCLYMPRIVATDYCRTNQLPGGGISPIRGVGRVDQACYSEVTKAAYWGPAIPDSYWIALENGAVVGAKISFGEVAFRMIVAGLIEKYGRPTTESVDTVQNRMGASFEDRTFRWERPDGSIQARQRAGGIDSSTVNMSTPGYAAKEAERAKGQGKAIAKQL